MTARLGLPDVIVNAAGFDRVEPFLDNDDDLWTALVAVNFASKLIGVTLDGTGAGANTHPLDMQTVSATVNISGNLTLKGATLVLGDAPANLVDKLSFVDGSAIAVSPFGATEAGSTEPAVARFRATTKEFSSAPR